jgi:autotransporter-associated beta strand protein
MNAIFLIGQSSARFLFLLNTFFSRFFFYPFFFALFFLPSLLNGQATLPLSRTAWATEPTGWTNSGCVQRTTASACSGNDATTFDTNGDSRSVYFSSMPDQLAFKLNKASMSGASKLVVEESSNGSTWTIIGSYGTATDATAIVGCSSTITLSLALTTRYVKWTYTKATGNCDMDDVSISQGYIPTKLVIKTISPNPPTVGIGFNVTVETQDVSNNAGNVLSTTTFSLSTNGNAGAIGGTVTGVINAGSNTATIANVTLSSIGIGATITATRTSGDVLTLAMSTSFEVIAPVLNDECSGATTIIADASMPTNSTSLNATQSLAAITCSKALSTGLLADVWFKFVATNVAHTVTVKPSANYDAVLELRYGSCNGTYFNCADGFGADTVEVVDGVNLTVGDTYYVRVYNFDGGSSTTPTFTIGVTTAIPTWSNASSSATWLTPANWSTKYAPVDGQIAHFANTGTATTANINMSTVSGLYSIAALDITSSRTRQLIISTSSSTVDGVLKLTGEILSSIPNTIIQNASSGNLTLVDGSSRLMGLALGNSTDNVINITGTGSVLLKSIISGSGKKLTKMGTGVGILTLSGSNTYDGLTTVTAGTLQLNRIGGNTIPATNDITITGGTLQISSNQTLNNLILNGGNVVIDDGITLTINGVLTLTSGKITLGTTGTGNVVIGATGSILPVSPTSASYIVTNGSGSLTQTHAANALKTYPIGSSATAYDPVKITPNGACSFSIKVASSINPSYTLSSQHASNATPRQWDITLLSGTPIVTLALTSSNLTHAPPAVSGIIGHWNATTWDDLIAAYASGTWTATAVSAFSPFIVSYLTPLSISLKDITVEAKDKGHLLNWTTISEKNNAYFDIQHATDNLFFKSIGQIKGQGTVNNTNNYTFNYRPNPSVKTYYYRLRQVDFDGSETISKIVSIESIIKNPELSIYPNNASDKLIVNYESNNIINYSIFNLFGQTVQSGQLNEQKELIISPLSTGMYLLKIEHSTVKFFKN